MIRPIRSVVTYTTGIIPPNIVSVIIELENFTKKEKGLEGVTNSSSVGALGPTFVSHHFLSLRNTLCNFREKERALDGLNPLTGLSFKHFADYIRYKR